MLPEPSDEQREILICFKQGFNLNVRAVAGAGKTTTLLLLAAEAKKSFNSKTLILTYNKDLKDEIFTKITSLGLNTHCDAYTYHGYASRIYRSNIYTDKILREHLARSADPKDLNKQPSLTPHDIILLDEVQDMNQDYHQLVTKMLAHGKILVLVGDKRQCINEYIGATSEYLVNYSKYFNTGRPWKELSLRKSYRLTPSVAKFVNSNVLCENIITPGNLKDRDVKPIYSHGTWDIERLVLRSVETYGADEVVIMLPSVRNINPKSPIGRLCSKHQSGVLFCVKDGDIANEIMKNKVLITSYNSMKGRERKCVIVVGFDESYFEYYDKKWSKTEPTLPNILYVAATRAKEQLIVIQDSAKPRLRTITTAKLFDTCEVRGDITEKIAKEHVTDKEKTYVVTDLTRHRSTTDTIDLLALIGTQTIQAPGETLPYQNIVQFNGYYEDMRQYYGTLIPLLAQYRKTQMINLVSYDEQSFVKVNKTLDTRVLRKYNFLLQKLDKTLSEWMELVVLNSCIMSNCYFYAYQITNYDWVDQNFINIQVERILIMLKDEKIGFFEHPISIKNSGSWVLQGCFDYFDEQEITEFKCATTLSDEHKMQCGAYISMYHKSQGELLPGKLFNTRTGEVMKITVKDPVKYLGIFVKSRMVDKMDELTQKLEKVVI
ncbi:DEAD helicase [uncultured virus]|nr:DEAD helicase [uncultured virus]